MRDICVSVQFPHCSWHLHNRRHATSRRMQLLQRNQILHKAVPACALPKHTQSGGCGQIDRATDANRRRLKTHRAIESGWPASSGSRVHAISWQAFLLLSHRISELRYWSIPLHQQSFVAERLAHQFAHSAGLKRASKDTTDSIHCHVFETRQLCAMATDTLCERTPQVCSRSSAHRELFARSIDDSTVSNSPRQIYL